MIKSLINSYTTNWTSFIYPVCSSPLPTPQPRTAPSFSPRTSEQSHLAPLSSWSWLTPATAQSNGWYNYRLKSLSAITIYCATIPERNRLRKKRQIHPGNHNFSSLFSAERYEILLDSRPVQITSSAISLNQSYCADRPWKSRRNLTKMSIL